MGWGMISSLLLAVFSIPVVTAYRIAPIEGTPYWLFGFLFLFLMWNLVIYLSPTLLPTWLKTQKVRLALLAACVSIVLGGATWTAVVDRSRVAPVYGVHDIILQQEAAMRYLLAGKNPYKEKYFGTPVEQFNYDEPGNTEAINPALFHFVMPPWYLLFPIGIYFLTTPILGYFDGRMALLVAAFGLLLVVWRWFRNREIASLAIVTAVLSPATVHFAIEGRSDIFALFWFVWALYLLDRNRIWSSAIMFGLALMSKQTIWFAAPVYLALLVFSKRSTKQVVTAVGVVAMVVLILAAPFILWDANAFIDSTVLYLSGAAAGSYPVSGYGLGMLLTQLGVIKDIHGYYPFIIWQIVFGLPWLFVLLRWFRQKPTSGRLLVAYALFLSVMWYMSRYFNNSHLGYLSTVFALGGLKIFDEEHHD